MLLTGQIMVTLFGPNTLSSHSFEFLVGGRTLEGTGA